jgi:hypothetical protein
LEATARKEVIMGECRSFDSHKCALVVILRVS